MFTLSDNVGPINVTFTDDESLEDLRSFEVAVRGLYPHSGGDYPEYCLSAILAALRFSFNNPEGYEFTPMHYNSHMVVITDAESKEESLKNEIIELAQDQEVTISFIVSHSALVSYEPYASIARETGGIIHLSSLSSTTWALAEFARTWSEKSTSDRKRRMAPIFGHVKVNVSVFATNLRVSIFCLGSSGTVRVTLPDNSTQTLPLVEQTTIYLQSSPLPGMYVFDYGSRSCETRVDVDDFLNIGVIFSNGNTTISSLTPPLACKSIYKKLCEVMI